MTDSVEPLPKLAHSSLSESVYKTLVDSLLQGHFKPGDRLRIRDLAEQLNTSVTPVRDAVHRLHHDGAVQFQTARNIRVVELTSEGYQEIREIRLQLESLSAGKAAEKASAADIRAIENMLAENEDAISRGDGIRGAELNQKFHFFLVEIARLPVLEAVLRPLWMRTGPLIAQGYLEGGRKMIEQHYHILAAIKGRQPDLAIEAMRRDLLDGGAPLIAMLEATKKDAASGAGDARPDAAAVK
ncbi:GntR family transcriptional regulator [Antarcticimicrobium luteum]|uniref:GntR family transcriptional regulator n=1 Tax=Antarcticimicrobium luteum TaxID=2547397 RepID=A0A4R5VFM6_9RHOB|nr:GntR family transcriptional regulator [Antarcticimicrobium luteum]TDK51397.1 GntR family transcriptional regulator [Antarcticimicrobium luteum]